MSQLSKQDLKAENQLQFPNNNTGLITPSNLKAFNVDMIDSTVNQTTYTGDSGSWTSDIATLQAEVLALENFSSSLSGGFVTEGELAAATASLINQINTKVSISETSSMTVLSASFALTAAFAQNANFDTGSYVGTASFNAYTSSTNNRLDNIESVSGSWITESETGSFARTDAQNVFSPLQTFGNVTVTGNLYVSGSEVIVSSSTLIVGDRIIEVNANRVIGDAGIYAFDALTDQTGSMIWDPYVDYWKAGLSGSETRVITAADTASMLSSYITSTQTGSFATTASNVFTGDQTLVDAGGNSVTLSDTSGSLMLVAKGFTSASAHLSASAGTFTNLIFKTNNNTGDTVISGSNNIFVNPSAPTAGFRRYMTSGNIWTSATAIPNVSASMAFPITISNNIGNPIISLRGPVSSSTWNINDNIFTNGVLNIGVTAANNAQKMISGCNVNYNVIQGTVQLRAQTSDLASPTVFSNNSVIGGTWTFIQTNSAVNVQSNLLMGQGSGWTFTNNWYSGSAGTGTVSFNGNTITGNNNIITLSGSTSPAGIATIFNTQMFGGYNDIYVNPTSTQYGIGQTFIAGNELTIYGTALQTDPLDALGTTVLGRYNATDGIRDRSRENILIVGTGDANGKKTGFLIDSGSNTFVEGTFNVSGSTSLNGNLIVTGSLTASLGQGLMYVGNASGLTSTISTASLAVENALTSSITRNVIVIARNSNPSTLPAGTVVHITSAVGDNPIFSTASYDTEALSSNTFGLLRNSSPSGADVEVVVSGVVTGVNTDPALGYTAGDILYLSSSGQFTRVQPQAPNQIVALGQVLRAQQNNGSVYVSINNGWELDELHNVQITSPQTDNLLVYESASYGLWKNKTISQVGLATTGSNTFIGTNSFSGSTSFTGSAPTIQSSSFSGSLITNLTDTYTDVAAVNQIVTLTSASYAALVTGSLTNPNTLYIVSGSTGTTGATFPYTGNAVITGSLGVSGSMFGGVIALSVVSSTASVDFSAANLFTLTLPSASTHINPTNIRAGQTINIQITQPTPGTGSVTFPSTVKFAGGNDYQATATGSAIDMLTFVSFDGTSVLATSIKNFL